MEKDSVFKKIYNFYSKDLNSTDFENLIMKETPSRYKYFVRNMDKPSKGRNKLEEFLYFIRNFAEAFLKKLTPVIRIIYTLTILFFIFSLINNDWNLAIFSFIVLNLVMIFEIADKLTARDELDVARDVQTGLITVRPPESENFNIEYYYETAKEVGGDFIDFISRSDKSFLVSIGDISGKGMSAALQMIQVRMLYRCISDNIENPKALLTSLNSNLFKHVSKKLYFSMILAEFKNNKLKICRAGHTPLLYFNSLENNCGEINQKGMALGLNNSELFENSLEEVEIAANPNDIILFYSDGLSEAMDAGKNEFGINRLKEIISNNSSKSVAEIMETILSEVSKFRGYAEVHDDIAFICMKAK